MPANDGQRTSLTATGTNFNLAAAKASYSAQKNLEHMRNNLQENASNKGHVAPTGAQSQSKISMNKHEGNVNGHMYANNAGIGSANSAQ